MRNSKPSTTKDHTGRLMGHHRVNLGHMVVTAQDTGPDTGMAMVVIEVMVVMVEVMAIARARPAGALLGAVAGGFLLGDILGGF